jgi:hypothetical protein
MDEGPFRVSRPAPRRVPSQPSPAARREEVQQPVREQVVEPIPVVPAKTDSKRSKKEKSSNRPSKSLIIIAVAVVLLVCGLLFWLLNRSDSNGIDSGKYQAVFLSNGQHYFGKVKDLNDKHLKLTEVYYLKRSSDENKSEDIQQSAGSQSGNLELKKLGDEIHAPEDEMIIFREHILYYENLNPNGQVSRGIEEYKKNL